MATLHVAWANCVRLSGQAVRVADPPEPLDRLAENLKEELMIRIDQKDGLTRIAPARETARSCRARDGHTPPATPKLLSAAE